MATDRHTDRQTDRQTDRRHAKNTFFWIQWPSKREHSSKSGSRFFGQMQYFLYTSYSRESKKGSVALIKEDNVPRLSWPLGVITELFPGKDGVV